MPEDEAPSPLQTAINCYLATLHSVAETLAQACPAVGNPYRRRISRLRKRLAFDANPAAMEESCDVLETELAEYAHRAALYVDRHRVVLRSGLTGMEEIVRTMAQRQDFYGERLRQFAAQMENTAYPSDPDHMAEVVALQAAGLLSVVESLSHESQSLTARMREELQQVERRIAEAEITDPVTGLMNRREWERRLAEAAPSEDAPTLLLFEFSCNLPDEVARQAAERITAQFRHHELISRWSENQFVVSFQGTPETLCARSGQLVQWIGGPYPLALGGALDVAVTVRRLDATELRAMA